MLVFTLRIIALVEELFCPIYFPLLSYSRKKPIRALVDLYLAGVDACSKS